MYKKSIMAVLFLLILLSISFIPSVSGTKTNSFEKISSTKILPPYFFSRIEGVVVPEYTYEPFINHWFSFNASYLELRHLVRYGDSHAISSGIFCAIIFIGSIKDTDLGPENSVYIKGIALGLIGIGTGC